MSQRIIGWFGLEGTSKGHPVQPPAMGRDKSNQIRLLRVPSKLALNVSRDGAAPSSPGSLGQGFTMLIVNNFFLISSLNLLKAITPCPVAKGPEKKPVPVFLLSPLLSTGMLQQGLPGAFSSPSSNKNNRFDFPFCAPLFLIKRWLTDEQLQLVCYRGF